MTNELPLSISSTGVVAADDLASMSGLDVLERIANGRFPAPPIAELLGFRPVVIEPGRAVFAATPDARLYNPIGSVHGGYAATLLDTCMACAVHSMLKAGQGYTTVELKVNFVRPLFADTGEVRAEGIREPRVRLIMLRVAKGYERVAQHAQERAKRFAAVEKRHSR